MALTIKPTLKTDHLKVGGLHAVRIRLTRNSIARYYTSGINVKSGDWNPKATTDKQNWIRTSHRDHAQLNEELAHLVKAFRDLHLAHPHYTAEQLRDSYNQGPAEEKPAGFLGFAREWIHRKEALGQHGTALAYKTALLYFTAFWGSRPDAAYLLTPGIAGQLAAALRAKGYAANTINNAFSCYRTIFRNALQEGWLPPMPNPFQVPKLSVPEKEITRPSVAQLLSLMEVKHLTQLQLHARNIFLMQYFLNGARISEVLTLRWQDVKESHVEYLPVKHGKRLKMVPRHAGVEWVLAQYPKQGKYVFPYLTEAQDKIKGADRVRLFQHLTGGINSALQRMAVKAGLPRLTTHMQRHVFAEQVWELTGNLRQVQELVGHSTATTTEHYLTKRLQVAVREELNQQLYAAVPEGKPVMKVVA